MDLSGLGIGKCGRYHTWSGFSTSGKTLRMYRLSSVGTTQVHHCKLWQVLGISEVVSLCFADGAWPLWNYLVSHGPWFSRATRHCSVHPQTLRSQQPYLWLSSPLVWLSGFLWNDQHHRIAGQDCSVHVSHSQNCEIGLSLACNSGFPRQVHPSGVNLAIGSPGLPLTSSNEYNRSVCLIHSNEQVNNRPGPQLWELYAL